MASVTTVESAVTAFGTKLISLTAQASAALLTAQAVLSTAAVLLLTSLHLLLGAGRPWSLLWTMLLSGPIYLCAAIFTAHWCSEHPESLRLNDSIATRRNLVAGILSAGVVLAAASSWSKNRLPRYGALGFGAGAVGVHAVILSVNYFNTVFREYWAELTLSKPGLTWPGGSNLPELAWSEGVKLPELTWSGLPLDPLSPYVQLSFGALGALLMILRMPRSVKDRATASDPCVSVVCDLPFDRRDLFYALLDSKEPLGVTATRVRVTQTRQIKEPEGRECTIVREGAKRIIDMDNGTIETQLCATQTLSEIEPPRSGRRRCTCESPE